MTEETKQDPCAITLLKFALILGGGFFRVYAMTVLWRWFLVPLGAPAVGFWQMCGLGTLIGLYRWESYDAERGKKLLTAEHITAFCLAPAWALFIGWAYLWLAR